MRWYKLSIIYLTNHINIATKQNIKDNTMLSLMEIQEFTFISAASSDILASFPLRRWREASHSFHWPALACQQKHLQPASTSWNAIFIILNTSEPDCENTFIKLYNLTNHLGDSGMKNRPKSCIIQGIAPGIMFYFGSINMSKARGFQREKERKFFTNHSQ